MSDKTYRIGVAGMVHDHVWGLAKSFANCPHAQLVAAADPNEPLRTRMESDFGATATFAEWGEMLDKVELDCLLITTENSRAADIAEAAAAKGIHMIVEKPMAATLAQADRMLKAAQAAGVQLMVNWATAWHPSVNKAVELVNAGAIGQVFDVRVRMAHHGPKELGCSEYFYGWLYDAEKNGAGAYMDYCCYGAAFCRHLLGKPNAVMGWTARLVKDYINVDDNGIVLMFYDTAVARAEGSWCEIPDYHDMVILGSKGKLATQKGKLLMGTEPRKPLEEVELPQLPAGKRNGPEYLLHCLQTGQDVAGMCSAQVGRDGQEILEAGLRSAATGQRIDLPLA